MVAPFAALLTTITSLNSSNERRNDIDMGKITSILSTTTWCSPNLSLLAVSCFPHSVEHADSDQHVVLYRQTYVNGKELFAHSYSGLLEKHKGNSHAKL